MTIPGHLVKRKSKTKTTVSWRLDLLKDKQIADTYRAQIRDLSHVVIDAMDEYQNIDQHQVDVRAGRRRHTPGSRAYRSVARSISSTAAWWTLRVCCDPLRDTGGVWAAMHSKLASDCRTLCDAAQAEKEQREMKALKLKRILFSRDADATPHCG
jgi:hypothetical protein